MSILYVPPLPVIFLFLIGIVLCIIYGVLAHREKEK